MRLNCSAVTLCLLLAVTQVYSIIFELEPNTRKCLRDNIPGKVAVSGEYHVTLAPNQRVDYVIKDSKGHILSQKEDVQLGKVSKFIFSTETYDQYETCFISTVPSNQRGVKQEVYLTIKTGVEAKPYEDMGEAAKLKPIEVELKKLEDLSVEIVKGFVQMRKNEEQMRDTNEATNARVFYFSIMSLCCVIGLSVWQAIYLRTYFKAKKLIE